VLALSCCAAADISLRQLEPLLLEPRPGSLADGSRRRHVHRDRRARDRAGAHAGRRGEPAPSDDRWRPARDPSSPRARGTSHVRVRAGIRLRRLGLPRAFLRRGRASVILRLLDSLSSEGRA
jgi:hypothetical protein